MVIINGTQAAAAGQTLGAYLAATSYDRTRIAVEKNGELVPRASYDQTVLKDGDIVEIVSFVGGG